MTTATSTSLKPQNGAQASSSYSDLEEFIYRISHDLRNSVRALVELPQWIEEDMQSDGHPISAPVRETLGLMHVHTRRLDKMLSDLLIYSRIGRMQTRSAVVMSECLARVTEELKPPAGFTIQSTFNVNVLSFGSRDMLTLLSALIDNAIKHHDGARGTIVVTTRSEADVVLLTVEDDGPGIATACQEHVFNVMTTLRSRDEVEGSGMGLAIARKITAHYGGTISIDKDNGTRGLRIIACFPRAAKCAD